ncbi:MAG: CoA-binding protein [Niabella sp.]
MINRKTLVLGASENKARYSNMAIRKLRGFGQEVVAIGRKEGIVEDVNILTGKPAFENIHTVTLYMSATNQQPYIDYLLSLHPKRIIFNPGAENDALAKAAQDNDIDTLEACTLVMLSTNQY